MKKISILHWHLLILLFAVFLGGCSDPDDNLSKEVKILWEKTVQKGCLNKDPFAFGPGSEYNVHLGSNLGRLYYLKSRPLASGETSAYINDENRLVHVDYNFAELIEDAQSKHLYLLEKGWDRHALYQVDELTLRKGEILFEENSLLLNDVKIFKEQLYTIESNQDGAQLVRYNLYKTEEKVIYTFDLESDEKVKIQSFYEYNDHVYGSFLVSRSKPPYGVDPHLIQLDIEEEKLLWSTTLPGHPKHIHYRNEEMYVFINGEETPLFNVESGEEVESLHFFSNEASFESISNEVVLFRDREYEDGFPIKEWLRCIDLVSQEELFSVEGLFLGMNNDKVYTYSHNEFTIRIRSLVDRNLEERIDLLKVFEDKILYTELKMVNGSDVILGQKDECAVSNLVLIQLP